MTGIFQRAGESVLVQGITGRVARRHTQVMSAYGTSIVAGVSPGRGGSRVDGIPIFNTVASATEATGATSSVAFLPPDAVGDGMVEAATTGIELMVCVTEGAGVHDVLEGLEAARAAGMRVVGPNSPGVASAERYLLGFLPIQDTPAGGCAILSRSGTLSYEAVDQLRRHGLGVSLWIGVGGDRLKGSTFADLLPDVLGDERSEAVVLIGEIGGTDEEDVAAALSESGLPAVALLAGRTAPAGVALGHAGAIVDGGDGGYLSKREHLQQAGVTVVSRPSELPEALSDSAA